MAKYILNMGGITTAQNDYTAAVDVFEEMGDTIKARPDIKLELSTPRAGLAAASSGHFVLAMGGYSDVDGNPVDTVDVFKATDTGIMLETGSNLKLSVGRGALGAVSCGRFILAIGGVQGRLDYDEFKPVDTVDVFEVTDTGIIKREDLKLSSARGMYLCVASSGRFILAMGGWATPNGYSDAVDVFEATDKGIIERRDLQFKLSKAREFGAAVSCGRFILYMGGAEDAGSDDNTIDVFEVTDNDVIKRTDLNLKLNKASGFYGVAVSHGRFILYMGGTTGGSPLNAVDVFEVTDTGIIARTDLNLLLSEGRLEATAAVSGQFAAIFGGINWGIHFSDTIDVFDFTNSMDCR